MSKILKSESCLYIIPTNNIQSLARKHYKHLNSLTTKIKYNVKWFRVCCNLLYLNLSLHEAYSFFDAIHDDDMRCYYTTTRVNTWQKHNKKKLNNTKILTYPHRHIKCVSLPTTYYWFNIRITRHFTGSNTRA